MFEIIDSFQAIADQDIAKLESELGSSFPEAFIQFYLKQNGGTLSHTGYEDDEGGYSDLESFFPIASEAPNPASVCNFVFDDFPEGYYPVLKFAEGKDVEYYLSFDTNNFGRVVIYDIHSGGERAVIESFDKLLSGLRDRPWPDFWTACQHEPWMSAERGNWQSVSEALDNKFDPNSIEEKENGFSILAVAAANRRLAIIQKLLDTGADVHSAGSNGITALHLAANVGRSPDVMRTLIEHGADINAKDAEGNTPLHLVGRYQTGQTVFAWLVNNGADFDLQNAKGLSCKQMYLNRLEKYPDKKGEWTPFLELMGAVK